MKHHWSLEPKKKYEMTRNVSQRSNELFFWVWTNLVLINVAGNNGDTWHLTRPENNLFQVPAELAKVKVELWYMC